MHEVLVVDELIRDIILKKGTAGEIKKKAMQLGMTTMLEDGFHKAAAGITTLEEILRVIHE